MTGETLRQIPIFNIKLTRRMEICFRSRPTINKSMGLMSGIQWLPQESRSKKIWRVMEAYLRTLYNLGKRRKTRMTGHSLTRLRNFSNPKLNMANLIKSSIANLLPLLLTGRNATHWSLAEQAYLTAIPNLQWWLKAAALWSAINATRKYNDSWTLLGKRM